MTCADQIQGDAHDVSKASGELLDLHWFLIQDALELNLPYVTRLVLRVIERRRGGGTRAAGLHPVQARSHHDGSSVGIRGTRPKTELGRRLPLSPQLAAPVQ